MEQYHVLESHPQLRIPGRYPAKDGSFDPGQFLDAELHYLRVMSEGMSGMVHADDVRRGRAPRPHRRAARPTPSWPARRGSARSTMPSSRCTASGVPTIPDLGELEASGMNEPMGYCFPHFFVLPMYSSASSYRFRPLGPEETLMEIWSLTRFPEGDEPGPLPEPEPWAHDDPRVPPIPVQDFSNLPRQQQGLRTRGFEYMRLSEQIEGHISNYHRLIDGYLAGLQQEQLVPALKHVNVNPLDRPIVDIGL